MLIKSYVCGPLNVARFKNKSRSICCNVSIEEAKASGPAQKHQSFKGKKKEKSFEGIPKTRRFKDLL